MALSGLQIYKLLPQTNCKECNFPTCMAFAMKLAAKQAELSACPYVSDAAKSQLEAAAAPPIRLVTISANGHKLAVGNETVLYRHEKTFYHPTGLFVRVRDSQPLDAVRAIAGAVAAVQGGLRGSGSRLRWLCIQSDSGDPAAFKACVAAVHGSKQRGADPRRRDPAVLEAGLAAAPDVPSRSWPPPRAELAGHGGAGQEVQAAPGRAGGQLDELARWRSRCRQPASRIWCWTRRTRAAGRLADGHDPVRGGSPSSTASATWASPSSPSRATG